MYFYSNCGSCVIDEFVLQHGVVGDTLPMKSQTPRVQTLSPIAVTSFSSDFSVRLRVV